MDHPVMGPALFTRTDLSLAVAPVDATPAYPQLQVHCQSNFWLISIQHGG